MKTKSTKNCGGKGIADSQSKFLAKKKKNLSIANIFQVSLSSPSDLDIGNLILKPPGRRPLTNIADSHVLDIFP